jgi:hypothetical protein
MAPFKSVLLSFAPRAEFFSIATTLLARLGSLMDVSIQSE